MAAIEEILTRVDHRTWPLPAGWWRYYQEWNNALFLHWQVNASLLLPLLPAGLTLDLFEGQAWVSIVPFTMERIRPRGLPALSVISSFHEINVRTYVTVDNKPGVYFLNIEASKAHSAWVSKTLSGMPYEKAVVKRYSQEKVHSYLSVNKRKGFRLEAVYQVGSPITAKSPLAIFLTERYCTYLEIAGRLYRYDVHHLPWELYQVHSSQLVTTYRFGDLLFDDQPDLMHYSPGVQVLAWEKKIV